MKTHAVDSLEKEIEHLQVKVSESENMSNGNMNDKISSRITELTSLIEDINGTESIGALKDIIYSFQRIPEMGGDDPMHHGGCDFPMGSGKMQDNSTDNSTEA